jgi:photosystem II stability/assembly factor-like uncharacterized protein
LAMAIDPTSPSTLYAGTDNGVYKSTNSGGSWSTVDTGLSGNALSVTALAIDPTTSSTLYAGTAGGGVFRSTDSGGSWSPVNTGLSGNALSVTALTIDPTTSSTLYAGTAGGVFSMEQVVACVGDCDGSGTVTVNEIITLVNMALGTADASACPHGVPSGGSVDVALIIQAVNNALNGCGG